MPVHAHEVLCCHLDWNGFSPVPKVVFIPKEPAKFRLRVRTGVGISTEHDSKGLSHLLQTTLRFVGGSEDECRGPLQTLEHKLVADTFYVRVLTAYFSEQGK